jgi:hypothetical protein
MGASSRIFGDSAVPRLHLEIRTCANSFVLFSARIPGYSAGVPQEKIMYLPTMKKERAPKEKTHMNRGKSVLAFLCVALIWIACTSAASAQNPKITRVSRIAPQKFQTITITGSGFGTQNAYTGDSDFISLLDTTTSWQAGYEGCLLGFCTTDTVTLVVNEWTDTKITLGGFSGDYGSNNFFLTVGDNEQISIFNPQTSAGPATINITVGATPTTTKLTSTPNPSNTGEAVKFTATVDSSAGSPPDGEVVTFMQGTKKIGSGKLESGSALFSTSKLTQGTHPITASYAGDSNFDSSTSNTVKQVVQ